MVCATTFLVGNYRQNTFSRSKTRKNTFLEQDGRVLSIRKYGVSRNSYGPSTTKLSTIHGHDDKNRDDARRVGAETMLRELCSRRDFIEPSDRVILFASVDRDLQRSTNSIMNLINVPQTLTHHSVKAAY